MAELTPQQILDDASCFACLPSMLLPTLQTVLLAKWLKELDPSADVTPNALLADGSCFACLQPSDLLIVQTILLDKILAAGGGGGGGGTQEVYQYTADPTTEGITPTDQTKPALAVQKDGTGPTFTWNTTTLVWQ